MLIILLIKIDLLGARWHQDWVRMVMAVGDWLHVRRNDQISKYTRDSGSQVSHSWRKELKIQKREKSRRPMDWNCILV